MADQSETNEDARLREAAIMIARLIERVETLERERDDAHVATAHDYRSRPPVMRGRTVQTNVGCGPLYITLNEDDAGQPFEVFFKLGKSGSCQQSYLEALGVAMSVGLRYGADPQKFVEKFEGMRCPNPRLRSAESKATLSCADGISQGLARALRIVVNGTDPHGASPLAVTEPTVDGAQDAPPLDLVDFVAAPNVATPQRKRPMFGNGLCSKCGGNLVMEGGCERCINDDCSYTGKCV